MPPGAKYVGRGTQWGNPYKDGNRETNVELYRIWLDALFVSFGEDEVRKWLKPLRNATALACWCKEGEACHADVLVEFCTRLFGPASEGGEENEP